MKLGITLFGNATGNNPTITPAIGEGKPVKDAGS